jgi:hypothetical protein
VKPSYASWPHLDGKTEGFETLCRRRVIYLGPAFPYAPWDQFDSPPTQKAAGSPPRGRLQPVLLGSGVTRFHEMTRQIDLKLLECRPFKNGCVLVKYHGER